jgi:hypothetical protein
MSKKRRGIITHLSYIVSSFIADWSTTYLDVLPSRPANTAYNEGGIAHKWRVTFIALFHIEAALTLRDHPSLHWRGQCPIVVADNVCARNFTVSSVRYRNSQWSHGECAE